MNRASAEPMPGLPERYLLDMCASAAMAAGAAGDRVALIGDPHFAAACLRRLRGVRVTLIGCWPEATADRAPPGSRIDVARGVADVPEPVGLVLWSPRTDGRASTPLVEAARLIAPRGTLYAAFRGPLAHLRAARPGVSAGEGDLSGDRARDWRACVPSRALASEEGGRVAERERQHHATDTAHPIASGEGGRVAPATPTRRLSEHARGHGRGGRPGAHGDTLAAASGDAPRHGAAASARAWNRVVLPGIHAPFGLRALRREAARCGLAIVEVYGFQSPRSLGWAMAARIADRSGRADLGDRCRFAMRATMVTRRATAWVCPVGLAVARGRTGASR